MLRIALLSLMGLFLAPSSGARVPADDQPLIVSDAWLAEHLHDANLVLFEVGKNEEYAGGHIAGAQHITQDDLAGPHDMSKMPMGLMLEAPSAARLDSVLSARGVSRDSRIVVYFANDYVTSSARVVLSLEYAGLRGQVSFLDGGRPGWVRDGRPLTKEAPQVVATKFTSRISPDVIVSLDWLKDRLHDPKVAVVDAREARFYNDTEDAGMNRGGHIPGAHSLPFSSLVDESLRFKDRATLQQLYSAAGAAPGKTVVSYCHVGMQGSLVYLVARSLGYDARLYDGSFEEWSANTAVAVEGASGKRRAQ